MSKFLQSNYLRYLSVFFIFSMPFFFNRDNAESPFELFKLSIYTAFVVVIALLFLLKLFKENSIEIFWNKSLALSGAVLLSAVASYLVSVNPYLSFWGDNLLPSDSLRSIVIFSIFTFVLAQLFTSYVEIKKIIYALLAVVVISTFYGVLQTYQLDPAWFSTYKLVYATIGNTTAYATLLGALSPLVLTSFVLQKEKSIKIALGVLIVALNFCILQTGTRTVLVVNVFTSLLVLLFNFKKSELKAFLSFFMLLLVSFLLFQYASVGSNLSEKIKVNYVNKAFVIRKLLTENAVEAWKQKPFLGYGPETFSVAQRPLQAQEMNNYQSWEFGWIKSHNHLMQIVVCTGLLGLFLQLMIFFYSSLKALKLFLKKDKTESDFFAFSFFAGYLFLFTANLTAFNFLPTQFYAWAFPIFFVLCLGDLQKKEVKLEKRLKVLLLFFLLIPLSYFGLISYRYWAADVEYQQARTNFEVKKNVVEALKLNAEALNLNEDEPMYHCQKALILEKALSQIQSKVSDTARKEALDQIDSSIKTCLDLGINRDVFVLLGANVYGQSYLDGIISDHNKALVLLDQLQKLTPVSPKVPLQKGIVYLKNGDDEKFIEQMQLAIKLKNDYMPAYIELLNYYYKKSKFDEAHQLAEKIDKTTFYASEQTEYLKDFVIIAEQNHDMQGQELFSAVLKKYKDFKDIN